MVRIIKTMTIGIKYQSAKELDGLLNNLGIYPLHVDFYETNVMGTVNICECVRLNVMGHKICRYYVKVQCTEDEEKRLLYCLNNEFKHDVTLLY